MEFTAIGMCPQFPTTHLGKRKLTFPRQMLHAETLGIIHPITKEYLEFSTPVPEDMKECIKELREAQA